MPRIGVVCVLSTSAQPCDWNSSGGHIERVGEHQQGGPTLALLCLCEREAMVLGSGDQAFESAGRVLPLGFPSLD